MSAAEKQYQHDTPRLTWHADLGQLVCDDSDDVVASMVDSDFGPNLAARFNTHDALVAALRKLVKYADSEPDGGTVVDCHRAIVEQARAALAKVSA